jgi:formylglycine-generating enzyme required for sulfatase activity/DNA-binding SARP family transcriptional activator
MTLNESFSRAGDVVAGLVLFGDPMFEGTPVKDLQERTRDRALLFYLTAEPDRRTRDELMRLLWDGGPARSPLNVALARLRKRWPGAISSSPRSEIVHWAGPPADAVLFQEYSKQAKAAVDGRTRQSALNAAIRLYKGTFLSGVNLPDAQPFEAWRRRMADRLEEEALQACATLAQLYLEEGNWDAALETADWGLAIRPTREALLRSACESAWHAHGPEAAQRRYEAGQDALRRAPDLEGTATEFTTWFGELRERLRLRRPDGDGLPSARAAAEATYLEDVGLRFRHWGSLYTALALSLRSRRRRAHVKSGEAARYLDLQHELYTRISHDLHEGNQEPLIIETFQEFVESIDAYKRLALIGEPGAGKTTTLERIAYEFAEQPLGKHRARLPLFVRLDDYEGDDFGLFLQEAFGSLTLQDYLPNGIIVLLDGLNQIKENHVSHIEEWLRANPDVHVVVSCRKLEYFERKLPLQRVDIAPFDVQRIFKFIEAFLEADDRDRLFWTLAGRETSDAWAWFRHTYPDAEFVDFWKGDVGRALSYEVEKLHISRIQRELREHGTLPGILGLVANPFLLINTIRVLDYRGEPPSNRAELFQQFVDLLLSSARAGGRRISWVDDEVLRSALAALAYRMQAERTGTAVAEEWAKAVLAEALVDCDPDQLLVCAASAQIIERGKSVRFVHQLIQEYFAAIEMGARVQASADPREYWPSDRWWEPTGWEETLLLCAGMLEDCSAVVRWLTPVQPTLAFRCATESGSRCDADLLLRLYEPAAGDRVSPMARAEWGRRLAQQGDSRAGVGLQSDGTPDIEWCDVPAGPFHMGGDFNTGQMGGAWEGAVIDIPYAYWIAKYPVTYAQFAAFVETGYEDPRYWTDAGWKWRGSQKQPRYWGDPTFHLSNHPVVGITWYEANAFGRWVDRLLHVFGVRLPGLPPAWEVRLSTEAEWEKAARHHDGRLYSWGNEYVPGFANVDETDENLTVGPHFLRRTTAVGMYAQGQHPNGAQDLSGNVWEWCQSKWSTDYVHPEDNAPEGVAHRVIRGGSWYDSAAYARCATRDNLDSEFGVNDIGMRLVLGPPLR